MLDALDMERFFSSSGQPQGAFERRMLSTLRDFLFLCIVTGSIRALDALDIERFFPSGR